MSSVVSVAAPRRSFSSAIRPRRRVPAILSGGRVSATGPKGGFPQRADRTREGEKRLRKGFRAGFAERRAGAGRKGGTTAYSAGGARAGLAAAGASPGASRIGAGAGPEGSAGATTNRPRPRIRPHFFKAHGHGNDYLVFEEGDGPVLTAEAVRRICDRRRGVGSDGIVVVEAGRRGMGRGEVAVAEGAGVGAALPGTGEVGPVRLRMFNPDGGEFERSGNGLRIAAAWLRRRRQVGGDPFPVRVGGDRVEMRVGAADQSGVRDAAVEMERAEFPVGPPFVAPGAVGRDGRVRLAVDRPKKEERVVRAVAVSIGNPHAVIFGEGWTRGEIVRLGPRIATHPAFPQGTNVQFAEPPRGRRLRIRIWERGVGHTLSSGTSACAAVAAAVRTGRLAPGRATVAMEGGAMEVTVSADWRVGLRGPVQDICTGTLAPGLLAQIP